MPLPTFASFASTFRHAGLALWRVVREARWVAACASLFTLTGFATGVGPWAQQAWTASLARLLPTQSLLAPIQLLATVGWNLSIAAMVVLSLWRLSVAPVGTRRLLWVGGGTALAVLVLATLGKGFSGADIQPQWSLFALAGGLVGRVSQQARKDWASRRRNLVEAEKQTSADHATTSYLNQLTGELRGTVNAVLGLADLITEKSTQAKQPAELLALRRAADSLNQSLSDIDELARVRGHRLQLHAVEVALLPLIHDQVNQVRQEAEAKGLQIQLCVGVDTPRHVMADARRVGQVIAHMLNHSVRSTRQGQIHLELRTHPRDLRMIRFVLTDTSMGAISGKLASMAAPFSDAILERARHGTGIGMSLAQELATLMGGRLTSRHSAGRGNVMIFTALLPSPTARLSLPVEPDHASAAPIKAKPARQAPALRLNLAGNDIKDVLLADDNPSTRALIESMLDKALFRVVSCANGREALQALSIAPYDIVLMDLHMPELDGMAAIKQIRRLESERRLRRTPVIALGDAPFDLERQRCLHAGFDQHLAKPMRKSRLLETMATLIRERPLAAPTGQRKGTARHGYVQRDALNLLAQGAGVDVTSAVAGLGGNAGIYLDAIEQLTPALYNWPARFRDTLARGETERARLMALDMQSILEVVRAVPCAAALGRVATMLSHTPPNTDKQQALADLDQHLQALLQSLRQAVDRLRDGRQDNIEQERRQNSAL